MQTVLSIAVVIVLATSLILVIRWGNLILTGHMPTRFFAFFAILFTSGLDVGLIMFPLTEFPVYRDEAVYGFTNPLAIEFGFWGFMIWIFYFLTTFYFSVLEPRLQLFPDSALSVHAPADRVDWSGGYCPVRGYCCSDHAAQSLPDIPG